MSDWPQRHWAYVDDEVKATQVVPAELARSQNVVLREVLAQYSDRPQLVELIQPILARYEKEVSDE